MIENDYFNKLDLAIIDTTKFVEVPLTDHHAYPIITKENSVGYYIRKYLKAYDRNLTKTLIASGSKCILEFIIDRVILPLSPCVLSFILRIAHVKSQR